jgi:thiol:disulfide interchange protein DsbC
MPPLPRAAAARRLFAACTLALLAAGSAFAQEAAIRKSLAERLPQLPKIDEVTKTPIPGLFEVRFGGNQILYADATGEYIFVNGSLIEVKTRNDLTEARIERLSMIDFDTLPLKDAITVRQGTGERKIAVFVDPNCGYCKRFERDLAAVKDVTIYTFLMPILGADSATKSRDIWCARDSAKAWRAWMLDNAPPPKSAASCDAGNLDRNLEFSKKHRINATPVVVFEDGTRKTGAMKLEQVDLLLAAARIKR